MARLDGNGTIIAMAASGMPASLGARENGAQEGATTGTLSVRMEYRCQRRRHCSRAASQHYAHVDGGKPKSAEKGVIPNPVEELPIVDRESDADRLLVTLSDAAAFFHASLLICKGLTGFRMNKQESKQPMYEQADKEPIP